MPFARTTPARRLIGAAVPLACATIWLAAPLRAAPTDWPRTINTEKGTMMIYQPQVEDLKGDMLTARAAFSITPTGKTEPLFGVCWTATKIQTDRDAGTVSTLGTKVTRVRMPGITADQEKKIAAFIEKEFPKWNLVISLAQLQAGLTAAERERASVDGLKADPPKIVYKTEPSVLVFMDGEPRLAKIENTDFQRVINTPFAIVYDPASKIYYLSGNNVWYSATAALGPWSPVAKPPAAVMALAPPDTSADSKTPSPPPKVVVATVPTELIWTDGAAKYSPIAGGELLFVSNTESDILREVPTQKYYVLISGRWYTSPKLEGPWTFVRSDQLPPSFAKIPPDSDMSHVLVSVAGTPQADDALANAQIPQTAAIKRSEAKLEVRYDGDPKFEKISGTEVEYAVNTSSQVLKIKGKYYAVEQGVWYVAGSPKGPWIVSDTRPPEADTIPPSSPVYNVKYVYVYDSTPEVVYVGYTPGYVGCYPYYGTVVWGTGWYYPPYVSPYVYYPRPVTYGFHAAYNPWTGAWGFGFTASNGFLTVGVGWGGGYYGGWYGMGGYYRPPYYGGGWYRPPGYYPGYPGYRPPGGYPGYRPPGGYPRPTPYAGAGGRPSQLPAGDNIYNRPGNSSRLAPSQQPASARQPKPATGRPDNVYAGRDGNVYQRDNSGNWQKREGDKWQGTGGQATAKDRGSQATARDRGSQAPSRELNRDYQARQRSSQGYSRSAGGSRGGYSGGGGSRGGGRGRRR
jgi:hypothetical protein